MGGLIHNYIDMGIDKPTKKIDRSTIYKYTLYLSSGHTLALIA